MLMTDAVALGMIGLVGTAFSSVMLVINTIVTNRIKTQSDEHGKDIREARASIVEQSHAIVTLEKNTNSIKDELVKVTGTSEFARGLKEGLESKRT